MDLIINSLKNEKGLLRTLIDIVPEWIYVKDHHARKVLSNAADLRNLGVKSEAEALGKDDYEFFPDKVAAAFYMDDMAVINSGEPVINRKERLIGPQGEVRWSLTNKIPLHNASGKVVGLIGIGRDITDQIQTHKSALLMIDEIGQALEAGHLDTAKRLIVILKRRLEND